MAPTPALLAGMNWTAQVRAVVTIGDATAPKERSRLSSEDFEYLVEEITDALELMGDVGDVTVGASLTQGWVEVSFSVDSSDLIAAQDKAMKVMMAAQDIAVQNLDRRLARKLVESQLPRMVSSQVAELVPA